MKCERELSSLTVLLAAELKPIEELAASWMLNLLACTRIAPRIRRMKKENGEEQRRFIENRNVQPCATQHTCCSHYWLHEWVFYWSGLELHSCTIACTIVLVAPQHSTEPTSSRSSPVKNRGSHRELPGHLEVRDQEHNIKS